MPSLASYWKFSTSLLEIRDVQERLETLIQRVLVGAVAGNKWWGSLNYRIRDFATKYGKQLTLELVARFGLTWRLARNTLPLVDWAFKSGLADMPDCFCCGSSLEETALHAFYYCERVRPFWSHDGEWTARINPKDLVLLDVGYVVDNVDPPYGGEKCVVFLTILAVARMVIWTTRKKGLYDGTNISHRDLILFFRHSLRVKIRCDRKRLDCITFDKRWVHAASLVVRKVATLESSFPPLPAHGDKDPDPSRPHPR